MRAAYADRAVSPSRPDVAARSETRLQVERVDGVEGRGHAGGGDGLGAGSRRPPRVGQGRLLEALGGLGVVGVQCPGDEPGQVRREPVAAPAIAACRSTKPAASAERAASPARRDAPSTPAADPPAPAPTRSAAGSTARRRPRPATRRTGRRPRAPRRPPRRPARPPPASPRPRPDTARSDVSTAGSGWPRAAGDSAVDREQVDQVHRQRQHVGLGEVGRPTSSSHLRERCRRVQSTHVRLVAHRVRERLKERGHGRRLEVTTDSSGGHKAESPCPQGETQIPAEGRVSIEPLRHRAHQTAASTQTPGPARIAARDCSWPPDSGRAPAPATPRRASAGTPSPRVHTHDVRQHTPPAGSPDDEGRRRNTSEALAHSVSLMRSCAIYLWSVECCGPSYSTPALRRSPTAPPSPSAPIRVADAHPETLRR